MWFEALTKDIGDFTSSLVKDTKSLANMLSRLAVEATGQGGFLAGDEESLLAQECPLDKADVIALQEDDAVYLVDPCHSDEKELFEEWSRRSVYSSANMQLGDKVDILGSSGSDEAVMTYRQQLLDGNSLMMEKYTAFVRACGQPQQKGMTEEEEENPKNLASSSSSLVLITNNKSEDNVITKPSSVVGFSNSGFLTEDMFFDRYFFRLSQLRLRTAAERRRREEEETQEEEEAATETTPEGERKPKSLTERLIALTDELIGCNDDVTTFGNNRDIEKMDKTPSEGGRTEADWQEQKQKVSALESLVKLLQEEVNNERRKLAVVLNIVHDCGLSEQQLQQLQTAMMMMTTTTTTTTTTLPPASVTSSLRGEKVKRGGEGSDNEGRETAVSGPGERQVTSGNELISLHSKSSSVDIESWAKV